MIIDLDDTLFIEIDRYNHTLYRKAGTMGDKGKVLKTNQVVGYYPNMRLSIWGAIKFYNGIDKDTTNFDGYLSKYESLMSRFKEWDI